MQLQGLGCKIDSTSVEISGGGLFICASLDSETIRRLELRLPDQTTKPLLAGEIDAPLFTREGDAFVFVDKGFEFDFDT